MITTRQDNKTRQKLQLEYETACLKTWAVLSLINPLACVVEKKGNKTSPQNDFFLHITEI